MKGIRVGDKVKRYCAFCNVEHLFICMRIDPGGTPQGRSTHRCPGLKEKPLFAMEDYVEQCLDVDYPPSGKRVFLSPEVFILEPNV